jgi:Skp family chaperone for outer membrane proteins
MKNFVFLLAMAFFLSLSLSPAHGYQKGPKTEAPSQEMKKEGQKVAQAKDASMKQEYEKYRKKTQGELNEYKKKMKQMEEKAKNLQGKAKVEVKEGMLAVEKKMGIAQQKLKSFESASREDWEKMKSEVDSAMAGVKESYEKVVSHFK